MKTGETPDNGLRIPAWSRGVRFFVCALCLLGSAVGVALADEELDYGLETHRLARIEISGNTTYSSGELKKLLRIQEATWTRPLHIAKYRPHLVDTQVGLLETFYRNRGFHQVSANLDSISTVVQEGDVLHISIDEGPRTIISRVAFEGNGPVSESRLREVLRLVEGQPAPADLNAFGGDIYAIRDLYRNETYLDATVRPSMMIEKVPGGPGYQAYVSYFIRPGQAYTVGEIRLAGNVSTHDNLLTRELVIAEGQPLYWQLVEDSRRQLLATSLFRDVTIVPVAVDTTSGQADLVVRVIERKPAFYEFGVGVGSLERIRVLAAWGHYNLWGTGRRFQIRTRGSWNVEDVVGNPIRFDQGQINYRVDAQYVNPHIRNSRFSFDLDLYTKRETRGESGLNMVSHGFNVGSTWKASRRVTNNAYFGLKVTSPTVHPHAPDSLKVRFEELGGTTDQTRSINWAIYIDHRDDLFRPTRGMYTVVTAKLAGGLMAGDFSFFKWSTAWHNYHRTPIGGTLALRFMAGGTRPYGRSLDRGPDGVPYDDRFFAGGSSTVRGYRHNSLGPQVTDQDELDRLNYSSDVLLPDNPARGGNYLMLTNVEWRFPLPVLRRWKFSSVFFFEGGNVWAQLRDVRMRGFRLSSEPGDPQDQASTKDWDYRYSYGTGIRFDTPFGPVRVDVGFPLKRVRYVSETRDLQDPKILWHFSLGYPF
ncbi:MAG: BamA/TamA family outer membrane protein [Candidatus Krumholzibacteriota bacterium]